MQEKYAGNLHIIKYFGGQIENENEIYEKEKSSKSDMKIILIAIRCQVRSNYVNPRSLTTSKEGAILRQAPKKWQ